MAQKKLSLKFSYDFFKFYKVNVNKNKHIDSLSVFPNSVLVYTWSVSDPIKDYLVYTCFVTVTRTSVLPKVECSN